MTRRGFTLLEMIVVLALISVAMGVSVSYFGDFRDRTAARRAADVFVRDLQVARATAMRERNTTSVVFDEVALSYVIRTSANRVVTTRDFGAAGEVRVQALDLQLTGDSVPFDPRGIATLAGAGGSLAKAVFRVRNHEFEVSFSALGAAEVAGN